MVKGNYARALSLALGLNHDSTTWVGSFVSWRRKGSKEGKASEMRGG